MCIRAIGSSYLVFFLIRVDGFDCIIDAVAGDYFKPGYELLTRGGRHVVYGAASFTPIGDKPNWLSLAWKFIRRPVIDPMQMMSDNKSVMVRAHPSSLGFTICKEHLQQSM